MVSQFHDYFDYYLNTFGDFSIIIGVQLEIIPEYGVKKCVYKNLGFKQGLHVEENYKQMMNYYDFVTLYTNWEKPMFNSVFTGVRVSSAEAKRNAANEELMYDEFCDEELYKAQLVESIAAVPGLPESVFVNSSYGQWDETTHTLVKSYQPPKVGKEIQAEYFVRVKDLPYAMKLLFKHKDLFKSQVVYTELNAMAKDNIPFSPAQHEDVVGINFVFRGNYSIAFNITEILEEILFEDEVLKDYIRPHLGKLYHYNKKRFRQIFDAEVQVMDRIFLHTGYIRPVSMENCQTKRLFYA